MVLWRKGCGAYLNAKEELRGDSQQVGIKGAESHLSQDEREIVLWRTGWDVGRESQEVKWPKIVVTNCFPKSLEVHSLTIVHVAFRRIISQQSVDQDLLLPFGEPAVLPAEATTRLSDTRGHETQGGDTDSSRDDTLDEK
jgi:hypothetical protein